MSTTARNSLITFLSQILTFALGFAASIILARALGVKGKGIYALVVLIPALMLKLGSMGIENSNIYFTGSKRYEIKDIVSNSLLYGILLSSILFLLFFCVFNLDVFQNYLVSNQINHFFVWMAVLSVPFSLFFSFLISVFLGAGKITVYNKINILNSAFKLILFVVFLVILKKGVLGAVISYLLCAIGVTLVVVLLTIKFTKITFSFNPKLFNDSMKYGLKAYLGNLIQFLNYRLDMLLVAAFLTPASVGFYSISVEIAEKLWMLPGAIATVLFPKISSLKGKEANSLTPKIARHAFLVIFVLALILALIARPVIKILFGSAFLPSVMPLMILLPGIIALGGGKILTADLAGRGKPQFGTYAAFVSLAVNVPLNLWLIPKWGISGAAFASSAAYITATLIVIAAFVKISNTTWISILFFNKNDFQESKKIVVKLRKIKKE